MSATDISALDERGLITRRSELRGEIAAMRLKRVGQATKDPAGLTRARRDLARIETAIRQREISADELPGALAMRVGSVGRDGLFASFQALLGFQKKDG